MTNITDVVLVSRADDRTHEALTRLARHVPPGVEIGKPLAAGWDADEQSTVFLTSVGWWFAYPASAARMIEVGEMIEITKWIGGREVGRYARHRDA